MDKVYNTKIPSKVQAFCWELLLKRLPTRSQLEKLGVIEGRHKEESEDRLFVKFLVSKQVWSSICAWIGVSEVVNARNIITHLSQFCWRIKS